MLRSAISDSLRSRGFIISWLNHTPHAIAVYASQPLSPAATQHLLPSGCYSLLGPYFHRLDRTRFWLAHHLLDHLVGKGQQPFRNGESKGFRDLPVNDQLVSYRVLYGQLGGARAFEDTIYIGRSAP